MDEWVQQQDLASDFGRRLEVANSLQKFRLLSQEAGLLNDAALTLHQLRRAEPENAEIAAAWTQFLHTMELSEMGEEPVANLSLIPIATPDS